MCFAPLLAIPAIFSYSRVCGWLTHFRSCHFMHPACSALGGGGGCCFFSSIRPGPSLLSALVLVQRISIRPLVITSLLKHLPLCASCVLCCACCLLPDLCVYVRVCLIQFFSKTGCVTLFLLHSGNLLTLVCFAASSLFCWGSCVSFHLRRLSRPKVTKNYIFLYIFVPVSA